MTRLRTSLRIDALRPTAVNTILAEVRQLRQRGAPPVSLMRGEPDLPTPSHIVAAAQQALDRGRTGYPDNQGEPALRAAVAARIAAQCGVHYSEDTEILITTGATQGIQAVLTALIDPGDEVLVPEPIYDAYHGAVALAGGSVRSVPATIADGRFALDPDRFEQACGSRTRALLLNTPWNPTGSVLTRSELEQLLKIARRHELVVISDEIYEASIYGDLSHISPASISDDARQRTVVVNSFSKTYAMTGWRLGYCAGPAELIRAVYLVLQQSSRGPATFVQDAGVAALEGPQDCVQQMRDEFARRRQQLCQALSELPRVRVLAPEAGFFAMLDVRETGIRCDTLRRRLLSEYGVVVVHGAAYGPSAEGTLRVSFASGGDTLNEGLERLRRGLEGAQRE